MDEVKQDVAKQAEAEAVEPGLPIAVTVFGMFNIAIGGLRLFTSPCTIFGIAMSGEAYGMTIGYTLFILLTYLLSLGLYFWLLSLGTGLIMLKKWARRGCVQYACVAIAWWVIRRGLDIYALTAWWVNPAEGDTPVYIARMFLSLIGFIYPVLLLYFMQTGKVKRAFAAIENK